MKGQGWWNNQCFNKMSEFSASALHCLLSFLQTGGIIKLDLTSRYCGHTAFCKPTLEIRILFLSFLFLACCDPIFNWLFFKKIKEVDVLRRKKWVANLKKWINAIVFMIIIPFHTLHWKKTTIATSSYFSYFFSVFPCGSFTGTRGSTFATS